MNSRANIDPVKLRAKRIKCQDEHLFFTRAFFKPRMGFKFSVNWHHEYMAWAIDEVIAGRIENLVINVPPGSGKTELLTNLIPRGIARNQRSRFLYLSFSQSLVEDVSSTARNIVKSADFQGLWPVKISTNTDAKASWKTTVDGYEAGHVYSASMGGQVTGRRAGTLADNGFTGAIILPEILNPAQAAFNAMGVKTQEQLDSAAQSAQANFDVISKSGQATADGIQSAYKLMLDATVATGDKAQVAIAQAKAASLGLQVQLDATGKATVSKLGEIQQAAVATQRTVSQVSQSTAREQPEISAEQKATNDHWDDFKAKMKARTDELNAKSQARGSGGGNTSLLSNGGDSTQQISAVPDAPLIATSLDIQPMEGMETKQSVEIKIDMGTGQTATVSAAPDQATALEEMMRELEAIKGRS